MLPPSKKGVTSSSHSRPLWLSERDLASDLKALVQKSVLFADEVDEERRYLCQRAPNAIEWITRPEFLNQPSLYRFYGAYDLIKEFFELSCPRPECRGKHPRKSWVAGQASTGLSRETMESEVLLTWKPAYEDDVCPKCNTTRAEFVEDGMMRNYRILHGIIGQRSGKSTALAQIGTYIEHVIYTIAHSNTGGLNSYLGSPPGDTYDISYVASTDTQAKLTIWAKYRGFRGQSPWFQRYTPWVKAQEKIQDTPEGMKKWEYTETEKLIKNQLVGINIDSLNSNSNGLAGRTRIFAAVDEICRMEITEGPRSGAEVYRSMIASCHSVQSAVERFGLVPWLGMIGSISSPISVADYGMQLLSVAHLDPRMYTQHLATWDFNPEQPFERFKEEMEKDPVGTIRNIGAKPPLATSPLIERPADFIEAAIDYDLVPTATFQTYEFVDTGDIDMLGVTVEKADLILRGEPRYIAVDAGFNFDAFSVACAHAEFDGEGNIITVFDWIVRLLTRSEKQQVYFTSVVDMIAQVQRGVTINLAEFDHWQSKQLIENMRALGIRAEESTTKPEHFVRFMRDAYSGRVKMLPPLPSDKADQDNPSGRIDPPYKSPQAAAIYEILSLQRDPLTDKIFNEAKGKRRGWSSDDTARVCVHVHRLVQDQAYVAKQDDNSPTARRKRGQQSRIQNMTGAESRCQSQVFHPGNKASFDPTKM